MKIESGLRNLVPSFPVTETNPANVRIQGIAGLSCRFAAWLRAIGLVAVVGGFASIPVVRAETAEPLKETKDWSFNVVPYLWVASLEVETGEPSGAGGVDRYETQISAGAMLATQVKYRSLGLLVDFAWLRLNTTSTSPGPLFTDVELTSDFIHTTTALTYDLPLKGRLRAQVLAGARIWYVNEEVDFDSGLLPGFETSRSHSWADPMIGAELRYVLSPHWSLMTKGMVGGFGVSSDLAWEALAGVTYQITDWSSASIGYRYLYEDYSSDGYALNLVAHGCIVGFGFHF